MGRKGDEQALSGGAVLGLPGQAWGGGHTRGCCTRRQLGQGNGGRLPTGRCAPRQGTHRRGNAAQGLRRSTRALCLHKDDEH